MGSKSALGHQNDIERGEKRAEGVLGAVQGDQGGLRGSSLRQYGVFGVVKVESPNPEMVGNAVRAGSVLHRECQILICRHLSLTFDTRQGAAD